MYSQTQHGDLTLFQPMKPEVRRELWPYLPDWIALYAERGLRRKRAP